MDDETYGGIYGGLTTEHAAAVIVIGALVFLAVVRRGFRGIGVSAGGISAGVGLK